MDFALCLPKRTAKLVMALIEVQLLHRCRVLLNHDFVMSESKPDGWLGWGGTMFEDYKKCTDSTSVMLALITDFSWHAVHYLTATRTEKPRFFCQSYANSIPSH